MKKKLLFFVESLSGGGAEKVLTDLISNLDKTKYDITVYSLVNVGVYNEYLKDICTYRSILPDVYQYKSKFKIKAYGLAYKLIHLLSTKLLYPLFIKEKYDTEIAFVEGYSTKFISGSNNPKSKKIAWVHIDLEANHWTRIEYKNLQEEIQAYSKFNTIVSVAQSVQDAFSRKFGITKGLEVKYNPVDRNEIVKNAKEPLKEKSKNGIRLVTVGRLEPQKGYDRLLEVARKLQEQKVDFELWILGEGSMRNELESYIQQHKLHSCVSLLGFHNNPYKFIAASDIFVCSSRSEGFSTVVTEALILEKPVVTTNCSGMQELLGHNEYGLITENNVEALFLGVKKMIEDKEYRLNYKQKAIEKSILFDIATTVKSIEELL